METGMLIQVSIDHDLPALYSGSSILYRMRKIPSFNDLKPYRAAYGRPQRLPPDRLSH